MRPLYQIIDVMTKRKMTVRFNSILGRLGMSVYTYEYHGDPEDSHHYDAKDMDTLEKEVMQDFAHLINMTAPTLPKPAMPLPPGFPCPPRV
jgi:hypothetical protein